ncbi:MAG: MBL fold metallo-hydrolase [Planctomycetota bacterium]
MSKLRLAIIAVLCCVLAEAALGVDPPTSQTALKNVQLDSSNLRVHFIDVGGGLAMLIETPGDRQHIFIDGGDRGGKELSRYVLKFVRKSEPIDILVVTHADQDHYLGAKKILKGYDVRQFWNTGYRHPNINKPNSGWEKFLEQVRHEHGCEIYMPLDDYVEAGEYEVIDDRNTEDEDDDVYVVYLNVDKEPPAVDPVSHRKVKESPRRNNASLVFKLVYGSVSFLITGDINGRPEELEEPADDEEINSKEYELLQRHRQSEEYSLKATVLQVPHHGSNGSSSLPFLKAVDPEWAVIPAGDRHGHPTLAALRRLKKADLPPTHILTTDQGDDETKEKDEPPGDDSFIFETDGATITAIHWVKIE